MSEEILVVGGGLIGLLTARELARAGERVHLLERGATGRESSWAGGGILSPLYPWRYADSVTALASWGQRHYADTVRELLEATGIDAELRPNGMLILHSDEVEQALAWARQHDIALECLTSEAAIRACEPALGETGETGLWFPTVAHVRNPRLLRAVRADIECLGVRVSEQAGVTGIHLQGDRVAGVETAAGALTAERVVVAGGAWSGELLKPLGLTLPVRPVRGQMLLFDAPADLLSRIVLSGDRYAIPRRDGHILVGSSLEEVGFDKETTAEVARFLRAEAERLVPALASYPVKLHWAGLRPGTPEGVPYIGPVAGIEGLAVNTGHYRNGVVLGLASARLLADTLLGRPPILDPAPYRVR